jgi:hypothetical protein
MIVGDLYKKKVPSNAKKGYSELTYCVRRCDTCEKEEEVTYSYLKEKRKNRGEERDICNKCRNLLENRKIPKGKESGNFKHGLTKNGYRRMTLDDGTRELEHRYVVSQSLGRKLKKEESVHHIDGDKLNNDISNLILCSKSEHAEIHKSLQNIGFSMLGDIIFFDYDNKCYTTKIIKKRECNLNIEFSPKLYQKKNHRVKDGGVYEYYYIQNNGKTLWKRWHIYLAQKKIGRKLKRNESVHHIDGNGLNNNVDNLWVMTISEHSTCHKSLEKVVLELYKLGHVKFDKESKRYISLPAGV